MASNDFLQSPYTFSGIVVGLASVIAKLYYDNKAKDAKIDERDKIITNLAQARVDDLKELNTSKNGTLSEIGTLVKLIYQKLESEKK